mgnify:FL=1
MNHQENEQLNKQIDERIKKVVSFTSRKLADTPTDNLMVTNRRYVNLNGVTADRPISSVATTGQQYFDTTIGRPIFWNGSNWIDGAGSVS